MIFLNDIKKTTDKENSFIINNIKLIKESKVDFYSLIASYINDKKFIKKFSSILNDDYRKKLPKLSLQEYIYQIIPVFFTTITSLFGLLLALSNFNKFQFIFSNQKVVIISFFITMIITIISITSVCFDITFNNKKILFKHWFYCNILKHMLNCPKNTFRNKNFVSAINEVLHDYYNKLMKDLSYKEVTPVKFLINSLKNVYHDFGYEYFLLNNEHTSGNINESKELFLFEKNIILSNPHQDYEIQMINIKTIFQTISNIPFFKKISNYVITSKKIVWETTIANLAMSAGLIGVLAGSIKAVSIFLKQPKITNYITSDYMAFYFLFLVLFVIIINIYCRLKENNIMIKRNKLYDKQRNLIVFLCNNRIIF